MQTTPHAPAQLATIPPGTLTDVPAPVETPTEDLDLLRVCQAQARLLTNVEDLAKRWSRSGHPGNQARGHQLLTLLRGR